MRTRRTRWYNSLTLRLLLLFWALLFVTASSGFLLALWQTKVTPPEPLAQEIRRTLFPLLSDAATFASLEPGRLVAGDYRVVARLLPQGKQQFVIDKSIASRHHSILLKQIDAGQPQQLPLDAVLLVGPFELNQTRLLLARPLTGEELRQRQISEQETREARAIALLIGSGVFALLLGFWLVRPIKRLIRATREVASGSPKPRLENLPRRSDEIGELARALDSTAQDLAVSRDAQRRLLSDVSHELRSPLARMQIALSLTVDESNNNDPNWQLIERDLSRLGNIIDSILSLSRLENGLVALTRKEVDTHTLVQQLIDDLCYVDDDTGHRVEQTDPDSNWPVLSTDPELLRLIIENLVRNALQYTDSKVELSASEVGPKGYVVVIRDYGEGVNETQLKHMFEPFFRADPSRHHQAGVGLGMALSRRAAGVLGGSISARNHPEGGLEVSVHLPVNPEDK